MSEIIIEITSLLEIPFAYQKAIEVYKRGGEDEEYRDGQDQLWNASIELIRIDFQDNFRRTQYKCIFKVIES